MSKKILIFGDSITAGFYDSQGGWAFRLKNLLMSKDRDNRIYPLGVSGDTGEDLLKRFFNEVKARVKEDEEREVVFIFAIGINDSNLEEGKNKVPLKEFEENILKLIKLALTFSKNIIFLGLTPVNEEKAKGYRNKEIKKYNDKLREICKENKIKFIEIFEKWIDLDYDKLLDEDGLHLNDRGHKRISHFVKAFFVS